ncbi:hypothetical protein CR513_43074, partial [Mucuna pruriens]
MGEYCWLMMKVLFIFIWWDCFVGGVFCGGKRRVMPCCAIYVIIELVFKDTWSLQVSFSLGVKKIHFSTPKDIVDVNLILMEIV